MKDLISLQRELDYWLSIAACGNERQAETAQDNIERVEAEIKSLKA